MIFVLLTIPFMLYIFKYKSVSNNRMHYCFTGEHKRQVVTMSTRLTAFFVVLLHICTSSAEGVCDHGWFGTNCQFQCHCDNSTCDETGLCPSKCEKRWFGSACQYQDLVTDTSAIINTSPSQTSYSWITDRNDTTCNNDASLLMVNVSWTITLPFTWLRITIKDIVYINNLTVSFITTTTPFTSNCFDQKIYFLNNNTIDIRCSMIVDTVSVILGGQGVKSLCSLYISGGRNAALRQTANQTSTYSTATASLAVDGYTNGTFDNNTCTHTAENDNSPQWTVTFDQSHTLSRIVLYNRIDRTCNGDCALRLNRFTLESFDSSNQLVFHYQDKSQQSISIYNVTVSRNESIMPVIRLTINLKNESSKPLTLCEVEVYGECVPGSWDLYCDKKCNSSCNSTCHVETGACQVCNGHKNPPLCKDACDSGTWGLDCRNTCYNCFENSCDSVTGLCEKGCIGYQDVPTCINECDSVNWGPNCTKNCSASCFQSSCDRNTGICNRGCSGYSNPPTCTNECSNGTWGTNCSKSCNTSCWENSCNHVTGFCDKGCKGYKNFPNCDIACDHGLWGINCTQSCKENCFNKSCSNQNGTCDKGCNGYNNPPDCDTSCNEGFYGINCSNRCSSNCSNNQCNSTVGHCFECIEEHTGQFCEALFVATSPNDSTPIGAIVGPIIAVIVICVLIFTGIILWRRRRAFKRAKHEDNDVDDATESKRLSNSYQETKFNALQKQPIDDTDNSYQGIYNNEGTYANLQSTSIAVKDLYSFMHSHNKEYFEQQFKSIPVPKNVTTEIGMSSLNKHKNRYKNICTYDHSRVHLEINTTRNEGDYINASYIKGHQKKDQFIASQGPNNNMLNDFIRMLWEQHVEKVVMLTNLIEEGTVKCEKYWTDEGTKQFGEIQIKLISTQTFSDYIIRVLELSKPSEAGQIFTQFHFTSWPDKGVPATPWGLVDFEQRVSAKSTSRPIVVHCSAGVGRTGTFIALSNVLKEAEETGCIDCFQTVVRLRQDRVLMIQTAEQYWFLHRAAQVAIVCIGTTVTLNDIVGRIKQLVERTITGKTKLEEEFKAICDVCNEFVEEPQEFEDSTTGDGNVYNNIEEMADRSKNRFVTIIPKQKYRPFLSCEDQNMSDYINAVFLPGFKKKDQQLLTQLPMPKTVVDFWRMVTQYKISLIVSFEVDAMTTDETFGQFLPAGVDKTLSCSPYVVKINDIKKSPLCEEQNLTIETEKQKSLLSLSSSNQASQAVIHLKCLITDLDPVKLLSLIRQLRSYNALADGKIAYTCSNGAKYSGLACVLSLLLDRMEHDSCLTVPLVVGTIKTIRPEVIPNVDHYRVLYQVLQRYSDNSVQYESLWNVAGKGAISSKTANSVFDETPDSDANIYANL